MSKTLLIVDDDAKDMLIASSVANAIGIDQLHRCDTLASALAFIEPCLRGQTPLPDAILLDLDLGHDSGYEFLRLWRTNAVLERVPLIVWSILSDHHRQMCDVFKVTCFLGKWEGQNALRDCLTQQVYANGASV